MALLVHPLAPLVVLALWEGLVLCALVAIGGNSGEGLTAIIGVGWAWMLVCWMDADARKLRRLPCFDFGLLAGVWLPVSLLWYCLWSRGWRGLLVLLVLFGLWLAPFVIAIIFGMMKRMAA